MGAPSRSRFGKALRRIRDGLQRRLAKVGVRAFAATALFGIGSTFVRGSTWEWVRALGRGTAWAALLALVGAGLVWLGGRRWRRTAPPGEAVREEGGALVFRVGAREVRVPLASIATGAVRSEPLAPGRPELRHLAAGPPF
ncbi:MAG TPA: hypothetical protein RMH85_11575 [Polyangiaceae bacterium LLY-WYZ-15_(1-7)]|nr:hypothetical protein [Myxococcales bacterium]MAT25639.1 hypothetical protein [Sandaracinus sp.]HJL01820.1 hypothetical protein [Polyangiaceae bacterium LLY-WYZ-15_(1-7)]MBJ70595.1 hypothetical protein [Sandaracinus sp.]HJL09136.1 hypothetical protein [Polyangiaceae bacterium LLY-WYZ-15_(1-7)]